MNNTDITRIRQLLLQAKTGVQKLSPANVGYPLYKEKIPLKILKKILALLPCQTCNGTGIPKIDPKMDLSSQWAVRRFPEPCPDCQPCKRCGGTNGKHKQVDDPQAGNSHMLTKMQCPLDK